MTEAGSPDIRVADIYGIVRHSVPQNINIFLQKPYGGLVLFYLGQKLSALRSKKPWGLSHTGHFFGAFLPRWM